MSNRSEQALNVIEPYIANLSQSDAFTVFRLLCEKFSWSGTVFTPVDVANRIQDRREADGLDPLTYEQLEEAVGLIVASGDWRDHLPDWMTSEGFEVIDQAIFDRLEVTA